MKIHHTLPSIELNPYLVFPESVGRYNGMPDHRVERVADSFPYFNLHYVASGEGFVEEDGVWRRLQAGDAFFYFPNRHQKYRSSEDNPWDIYWMHFYGERLAELLTEQGLRRSIVWTTSRHDLLLEHFEGLFREIRSRNFLRPSLLSMLAYGIVTEFATQVVPHSLHRNSRGTPRALADLLPSIQETACEPFSLEHWSERLGISPYYFCKIFRKTVQMTPMDFITMCRIRQAKQKLLDDPDFPVHLVAEACGYSSVSYFIKRFKEKEGVTPTAYRQLHA
jgi:AraC-like DNA-binding protein